MFDLHVHTVFSDGVLVPAEIGRRFAEAGYDLVGIADHTDFTNVDRIGDVKEGVERQSTDEIDVHVGAELTHVPPEKIPELAGLAKESGAEYVVVHGETTAEPVAPGTNEAATDCSDVDILAHPGNISPESAEAAAENDVYLEITTRSTHGSTNGHVAETGLEAGASLILNSDFHTPKDLVDDGRRREVAREAGVDLDDGAFLQDPGEVLA